MNSKSLRVQSADHLLSTKQDAVERSASASSFGRRSAILRRWNTVAVLRLYRESTEGNVLPEAINKNNNSRNCG